MRLIPKHRHDRRGRAPRISITQEEILADLRYPAGRRAGRVEPPTRRRRG